MRTHSRHVMLIAALTALLVAPSAFAQGARRGGHGPGGHGGPGGRMAEALNLSEAQQEQLRALRSEMRQDSQPAREDLRELRGQLRELWQAETPNLQAINALGQRIDTLEGVLRERQVQFRLASANILTADQRAQLSQRAGRRGGPGMHRGGHRGGGEGMGHGRRGRGGEGMGQRIAERLGLDASQQQQIQALRTELRQDLEPTHQQMQALREQLRDAWSADQPSEADILALGEQMDRLQSSARVRRNQFRAEMLSLLTPDQRTQLNQLRERRGQGHHGRGHGPRGRRGQGQSSEGEAI